jgi:cytoskeleton protein RodZ
MSEENLASSEIGSEALPGLAVSSAALPETSVLSVGQQLRAAREEKNVTVVDVAKVLKLSAHQVVALEEDDWARLPGNTIIRGFVRNYARFLKLDADPLMSALSAAQEPLSPKLDLPAGTNTAMPQPGTVERKDFATVFSGALLIVLAVLAYFFMPQDLWRSKLTELVDGIKVFELFTDKAGKPKPSDASVPLAPPSAITQLAAEAATLPTSPVPTVASVRAETDQVPVTDISGGLKLSFAQPSWVEIRDRSGQIIFSQLNPAGSQRDIEGQPPFALVIGNATNVTVQYKGKVIELSQRSKDDVARLNLD